MKSNVYVISLVISLLLRISHYPPIENISKCQYRNHSTFYFSLLFFLLNFMMIHLPNSFIILSFSLILPTKGKIIKVSHNTKVNINIKIQIRKSSKTIVILMLGTANISKPTNIIDTSIVARKTITSPSTYNLNILKSHLEPLLNHLIFSNYCICYLFLKICY